MHTISNLGKEDFEKYKNILELFGLASGEEIDDGYKICINGRDFILFPFGPLFMLYYEENGEVKQSILQTNENGKIESFTMNGKQVVVNNNGLFLIDEEHNQEGLRFVGDKNVDLDAYSNNGVVIYTQYHAKDDLLLDLRYEHNMISRDGEIFAYHTNDPFYVSFKQNVSKRYSFLNFAKNYYRVDFDARDNKFLYDLATLREYGIGAVWSHGTIALHGGYEFSKFYRELVRFGDYSSILSFPLSKGLDEEDIDMMISNCGFNKQVPQSMIDFYNNSSRLVRNRQELLDLYYCYTSSDVMKKGK